MIPKWLEISRGNAPLLVSIPHTGLDLQSLDNRLISPWRATRDADWHIEKLYDFARELDATIVRTSISRTVIDVNRDPSGVSLYPGQATTELCPTTTFDGEPLYQAGQEPSPAEINARRLDYFDPYHQALADEVERLRSRHQHIVVYDCHSIRSIIPRLFEGTLPQFNIGTNSGLSCAPELTARIEAICKASDYSQITNGRFKGGYITRGLGRPDHGIHAVQMELACRGYVDEPLGPVSEADWPPSYDPAYAAPMRGVLKKILMSAFEFTGTSKH
jgi:N-formylglutamate deformylase